ncbi:1-acyl-sn-glycerol-3-phosphate acyltransferase [Gallalistipes aquisgranensis]|uniref:1-acyl-sn-glycerol-3-phosphate acyltransferase n=1 Tax=Gallalistipes aquisgranensis TaxID=2779358 RepID=UPI001CF92197|nr:1-acyl-sn-glycerol-3-phosphate acyltransferase [Gallalistipes aquisgranensis]MBE5034259.1 acyltransferase [Gallalistipes aquisgranensis]
MEVSVAEVLRKKNPAAARWIPGFAVRYLARIVHEEEVNSYLRDFADLDAIHFVKACLERMRIGYRAEGMEKLDPQGRYIFTSNHPFGGVDGLMLADEVSKHFGDVRVVVNDILMNLTPLAPLFIPVNKHGRQNPAYLRMFNEAFDSQLPIVTFPAGLCSRRTNGTVADAPWKSNFVKRAVASRRDIVPVHFDGELSNFFYRLSNIRKRLGIKANIEMLYLADEMFKQGGRHFDIRIGDPVPWQEIRAEGTPARWAERIRTNAYNLKNSGR